jgi:hypothetical protein
MVLGMARSGTSAITRGLKAIGVDLGDKLHQPDQRNPKGFWEDNDVNYKVNRSILRSMGYPWFCAGLADHLRLKDNAVLNGMIPYAVNLVQDRLAGVKCWGFKDTNTIQLLPFWQTVIAEAGAEDRYVIALRNPLGCAHSNIRHSNLELEAGLLGWLKCIILAVDGTHHKKRVVVSYDLLLNDPVTALQHMSRGLDIEIRNNAEVDFYARNFLDKKLHHHVYGETDLQNDVAIAAVPLCLRVYALMMRLASNSLSFADQDFLTEWAAIRVEFDAYRPLYTYANTIQKQNQQLEREIRAIHKSFIWKLVYPLRRLDDALRVRRKAARQSRRLVKAYG